MIAANGNGAGADAHTPSQHGAHRHVDAGHGLARPDAVHHDRLHHADAHAHPHVAPAEHADPPSAASTRRTCGVVLKPPCSQ